MDSALATQPTLRRLRKLACVRRPGMTIIGILSVALGVLHAAFDPVLGIDPGRRVDAFGGKPHHVDDFGLCLLLIETVGAVGGLLNSLMTVSERKLHLPVGRFIRDTFKCTD